MEKNLLKALLFALFLSVSVTAFTQSGFIESKNSVVKGKLTSSVNFSLKDSFKSDKWGWSLWALIGKNWSEIIAGPTFSPTKWVTLSASAGFETNKKDGPSLRKAWSIWVGEGSFSFYSTNETGVSGSKWSKNIGKYALSRRFKIGVVSETGIGNAPYLEGAINKNSSLSVAPYKRQTNFSLILKF